MRPVDQIQSHLEAIYDLEGAPRASDFLIDRDVMVRLVDAGLISASLAETDEQVLLLPHDDGLSLAVWLSDQVRAGLQGPRSLQVHCHATEAVSHFLMILWNAREGRQVRLLDLELQAEVDKIATALLDDLRVGGGAGGERLVRRLFDDVRFADHLSVEEHQRYREAHRLARNYAARLAELLGEGTDRLLAELRRVYRLPSEGKLQHIARAA